MTWRKKLFRGKYRGLLGSANRPRISLSVSSVEENVAAGTLVGVLSVTNGEGIYAFTMTNDAGGLFELDVGDDTRVEVAGALDYETATSHEITISADNGVDPAIVRSFTITILDVDEIAPVLSAPDVDEITETTATAHVTTDEGNGTLYVVISDSTNVPSAAQVKAGQDAAGAAADFADDQAVISTGVKSFPITGLTGSTDYWFYAMHEDAAGNQSNVIDFGSFQTSALTLDPGTLAWDTNGATGVRPSFTLTLSGAAAEGDVPKVYTKDSDDVAFTLYITGDALDAADITAGEVTLTGGSDLAEDAWQAHARLDRGGSLGDLSNEVVFDIDLPSTPTLDLTSGVTDNTPDFELTSSDLVLGDTVRFQWDTVNTFDVDPQEATNEVDSGEDAANLLQFATGTLADDEWFFRARVERPLFGPSAWSNIETITIDTTPPTASVFSPLDNATDVAINSNLTVQFSENVSFDSTVSITIKKTSDNSTVEAFDETDIGVGISIVGDTLTINPTSDLTNSTEYYVQIDSSSIKDAAGHFYAGISSTTAWSFTTVAAGGGSAVAFTDSAVDAVDRQIYTFAGQSLGVEAADRVIVVGVGGRAAAQQTISSVTIGGNAASSIVSVATGNSNAALYALAVPTGTTADIVVTFSGAVVRCGIVVWAMTGVSATAADTGSSTSDPATDTLIVPTDGIAIGYGFSTHGSATLTATWTNLTEDVDELVENLNAQTGASASIPAGGATALTCDWSQAPSVGRAVFAAFGP